MVFLSISSGTPNLYESFQADMENTHSISSSTSVTMLTVGVLYFSLPPGLVIVYFGVTKTLFISVFRIASLQIINNSDKIFKYTEAECTIPTSTILSTFLYKKFPEDSTSQDESNIFSLEITKRFKVVFIWFVYDADCF